MSQEAKMEEIKCTEEMDKFFSRLAEFKKEFKEAVEDAQDGIFQDLYDDLDEFFKVEGEE